MHPRIKELLDHLDARRDELRAAVEGIPEHRRDVAPAPDRWSVARVLEHLTLVESRIDGLFKTRLAEARAAGLGPETETSAVMSPGETEIVLDRSRRLTAPETVQPKPNADATSSWRELEQVRASFRSTILDADGLALGEVVHPNRVFGPMNLYKWIAFVGNHEARHAAQIREIGDQLAAASASASEAPVAI